MHYYQHHIGDFIRDTANLTDSQVMAYLRLIWMYYDSEKPLPDNAKVLAFKIGSTEETVSLILEAFFTKEDGAWRHSRCESELAEYNVIRERNIANGKNGGRPKKTQTKPTGFPAGTQKGPKNTGFSGEKIGSGASNTEPEPIGEPVGTQSKPSGFPVGYQSEPSRNPNQEPVTSNQEPKNTNPPLPPKGEVVDAIAMEFEEIWRIIPKRAGDTPSATLRAYRERRKQHGREEIRAGVDRYVAYCKAQKAADPAWDYQKGAKVFFGPDLHFQAGWDVPKNLKSRRVDDDVFAGCI